MAGRFPQIHTLPTSSPEFSTRLEPSSFARQIVLGTGVGLHLAGAVALMTLALPISTRLVLCLLWAAWGLSELAGIRRQFARVRYFNFDTAGVLAAGPGESAAMPVVPLRGTIALNRAIWLRYRGANGHTGVELILGRSREDPCFRRAIIVLRMQPFPGNH